MAENLRPEGIPVTIGTVRISTPGLTGRVEVYQPGTAGMRGAESSTEAFRRALDDAGVVEQLTVEITGQRELDNAGGSRGGGGGSEIVVEVPPPGTGNGQLLLYAAEDGSLSWHLPDDLPPDQVVSRGGDRRTYRLPREVVLADPASAGGQRGILGALGSKLFKILVFPSSTRSSARSATTSPGGGSRRTGATSCGGSTRATTSAPTSRRSRRRTGRG